MNNVFLDTNVFFWDILGDASIWSTHRFWRKGGKKLCVYYLLLHKKPPQISLLKIKMYGFIPQVCGLTGLSWKVYLLLEGRV